MRHFSLVKCFCIGKWYLESSLFIIFLNPGISLAKKLPLHDLAPELAMNGHDMVWTYQ